MTLAAYESLGKQIGLNENDQRTALSEYLSNGGVNLDPAVTAWCAGAVNAALGEAGIDGTGKLNARSFLDWGQPVDQPTKGDVAVFSRGDPNGWQGHVGFFDGYNDDGTIRVLGGNQGDGVNISSYSADKLLGFRRADEGYGETGNALRGPEPDPMGQNALAAMLAQQQPAPQLTPGVVDPMAAFLMGQRARSNFA
jgi:uncharacterized protein (TIGR02594 family)